ncbi:MAG: NADH-quinone oxidoreductase subunit J [Acinetobacter sp.]|uniref:NADH-quinone oxidoreductase subunit J n=1 Tax=Acinetobacter sp. TaxID=472 RepID=UPI000F9B75C6|nr:NADH-quinone oxidoreductase subunit J [Acinetobacter sp.]RUP42036.1 MAG: NADH-quinone oxidoreductase subunit J [Acinetobacter sp.]
MALFFYMFAILTVISGLMVITSRNPVHAVLWLIFAFCNGAGLMVLMGAEFIAMMLIIIYVGAVAVLFLFVVMMLDVKFAEFTGKIRQEMTFAFVMATFLFIDLVIIVLLGSKTIVMAPSGFAISTDLGNAYAIGRVLYTEFILPFQTCGIILFVGMIASIALTLRTRDGVKRQDVGAQIARNKDNSIEFAQSNGKQGLNNLNYDN